MLSYCGQQARIHDPDRALSALFAPEPARGALLALLAFNAEIERVPRMVREPILGQIRLQWWRDALAAQRSSGVARVSYDGKTVDYRSLAEIDRAIEALNRELAGLEGRKVVRQIRVIAGKGL